MNKLSLRDIDLAGKRVLVRVDFNVPLDGGRITDDTRIRAAVPTIKSIRRQRPRAVILMSHLGRPKGVRRDDMSLAPVAPLLASALGCDVAFADDCVGEVAEQAVESLPGGGVLLLENTRFHAGETKNDPAFAGRLARLGDVFVNDAFGTAHRAHASNVGLSERLGAAAGLLLEKEIDYLATALESPRTPFIAIIGGAVLVSTTVRPAGRWSIRPLSPRHTVRTSRPEGSDSRIRSHAPASAAMEDVIAAPSAASRSSGAGSRS